MTGFKEHREEIQKDLEELISQIKEDPKYKNRSYSPLDIRQEVSLYAF